MSDIAIKVNGLSKRYRIGLKEEIHDTLVGAALAFLKSPAKNLKRLRKLSHFEDGRDEEDIIWALREVSFEVQKGEVVGVIGRNGAGKSTLLKVLAGITYPTAGRAEIDGRVASLLEVGTGFHQELTGRENVYLNGTILGMTRKEIDRKFDEIVDFSGVEKFIDTPVKRYSSGMRVRLAFSVAAHLEAEILLIDEVLAVGDTAFQQKCLGKMGEVSKEGRTVLLVSHNMGSILSLCNQAMLINSGVIAEMGDTQGTVNQYLETNVYFPMEDEAHYDLTDRKNPYSKDIFVESLIIRDREGRKNNNIPMNEVMELELHLKGMDKYPSAQVGIFMKTSFGQRVFTFDSGMVNKTPEVSFSGNDRAIMRVNNLPLNPGMYYIDVVIAHKGVSRIDYIESAAKINVVFSDVYGNGYNITDYFGVTYILNSSWEFSKRG
ncbi:MAG: ABC transporter ATP-binding protein [Anaerolineales bacterium]|jgi:lipopolysaccharide transport system ATP-binding protein